MTTSQEVFRRQIRRLILVPLIVSLLIAAVLELQVRRLTLAQELVRHSDYVIAQARLLLRSVIDEETGLRGYVLSRDLQFLQPYRTADQQLPHLFDEMHERLADNPIQQSKLEAVRESFNRWHSYAEDAIARTGKNDPMVQEAGFNLKGKQMMDEVRQRQQEFVDEEDRMREARLQGSDRAGRTMSWTLLGLVSVFALALLNEARSNLKAVDREYGSILGDLRNRSAELSQSRERLQVTLSSIGDAVIVTDAEAKITFMNPVAEKLTLCPLAEAAGKHVDEVFRIVNEDTRLKTESPFSKVMRLGTVVGLANHTILLRRDGTEISIDDSGAPIRDEAGEIFGVVLVFRDVTEQKEILNTLRTNEKLAATGKLSASIAHEIHNPLETVQNLFFLIRRQANPDLASLIDIGEQELTRVVQITKNMLSLYRESKNTTAVKLSEIVDSVEGLLQSSLRKKSIQFSKHYLTQAPISAFPAEMRQVASNLILNAIDAVDPNGSITVNVEDVLTKDSQPGVALMVTDNGTGIAKEDRGKLFRPFFTTKGENGTGLGLWITQGIVSKHGGYIEVTSDTSRQKHGTTFRVVFPRAAGE